MERLRKFTGDFALDGVAFGRENPRQQMPPGIGSLSVTCFSNHIWLWAGDVWQIHFLF